MLTDFVSHERPAAPFPSWVYCNSSKLHKIWVKHIRYAVCVRASVYLGALCVERDWHAMRCR